MKIEIYHDILAKKVLEKVSGEKKILRKIERLMEERYALYLQNNKSKKGLLSQNDLDTILPFSNSLNFSKEQQLFIDRSKRAQRRTAQLRIATIVVIGVILALLTWSIRQTAAANKAEKAANEALIEAEKNYRKYKAEQEEARKAEAEVATLSKKIDKQSTDKSNQGLAAFDSKSFTKDAQISEILTRFAVQIESDSLWFNNRNPEALQDNSGIVHRTLQYLSSLSDEIKIPPVGDYRNSVSIATWYNENSALTVINDALAQRNLIRPGTILFYGKSGQTYTNLTLDQLQRKAPNRVIQHIGVVIDTDKDDNGDVISYTLLQGSRPGKVAARSYYHSVKPPREGFPILGNWNQQWVGIAFPLTTIQ